MLAEKNFVLGNGWKKSIIWYHKKSGFLVIVNLETLIRNINLETRLLTW